MDAKDELAKMIAETECEIEILKQNLSNKKEDLEVRNAPLKYSRERTVQFISPSNLREVMDILP